MEFVFALPDSCSVAWGSGGVWLTRGEAWFADDPFVVAHPEYFSSVPPNVRSSTGRTVAQSPMLVEPVPAPPRRSRANG
jgi:hypothetical protein